MQILHIMIKYITMKFAQRVSHWLNAGLDASFFRTYKEDIHKYTVSFISTFYKIMTTVFVLIVVATLCLPDIPPLQHIRALVPFGITYAAYMALCLILYCTLIKKNIKASFLFSQITLILFGFLLLWLDFSTADNLAVFIPVYFAFFPMLLTVPVPALMLDLAILYIVTIAGTIIFKEPRIVVEDIVNISICLAAGFFIGCKNIRSKLAEIQANSNTKSYSAMQKSVIDALIDEYSCLATVDLDKDTINIMLVNDDFSTYTNSLLTIGSFKERVKEFARLNVHPDDKKRYLVTMSKDNILEHMKTEKSLAINFRVVNNGQELYVQSKLIKDISVPAGGNKFVLTHRSIDNEVKMEQMITNTLRLASLDSLTGVRNRTAYDADVKELKERLNSGEQKEAGIVLVDVNWLKETNDKMGHTAGDDLLRSVNNVICSIYKHSPVYRIGGDEFAVLMSSYDLLIREKLLGLARNATAKTKYGVSFASGMAVFEAPDVTFDDTIKRADNEMYKNKKEIKSAASSEM